MTTTPLSGPTIARGRSKQNYKTPDNFMCAVRKRFFPLGELAWDLAADETNFQCRDFYCKEQNSLIQHWHKIDGWLWLNPEFGDIEPWACKCAHEAQLGARILFLTPASIGANWFQEWVHPNAVTLALNPRLSFDGIAPYPKDCQLSVFCAGLSGFNTWRWK